jgi:hypothetical protein
VYNNNVKVRKYNSNKLVTININKYKIDWNKAPSKGQKILQDFLYTFWKNNLVLQECRIPGALFRFDLLNCTKKIIIEYSPLSHHNNFNKFFHRSRSGYLKSLKSDINKRKWAESNGFKVIDIQESDLENLSILYIYDKFGISLI